ncbi:MAG: DUF996 domain-containing protein [Aquificaceae bacterium]
MQKDLKTPNILTGTGFVIAFAGTLSGILPSIIGAILILAGLYMLSESLSLKAFERALISFLIAFISVVIFFTLILKSIVGLIFGSFKLSPAIIAISGMTFLLGFLISYILSLISAYFFFRAMSEVSEAIKHPLILLSGVVVLIGAATIIVFGFGIVIIAIGLLIGAIAFFTAPTELKVSEYSPPDLPPEKELPPGR